jgi:putative membrane protein insertion efficiency factor
MVERSQASDAAARAARWALLAPVYLYKALSAMTPGACRFQPTCSDYALTAIRTHGALRGGWLTVRRLSRCHPLGSWGYDPVPERAADSRHCGCGDTSLGRSGASRASDRNELA